jgi:hypothetical protein
MDQVHTGWKVTGASHRSFERLLLGLGERCEALKLLDQRIRHSLVVTPEFPSEK